VAIATAVLSWLGLYLHTSAELPNESLLSSETAYPTLVYLLGITAWLTVGRRAGAWLLLGWGWLNLVGGAVLSVLPLPIWAYDPAQTARHYAFHLLYGVLQ